MSDARYKLNLLECTFRIYHIHVNNDIIMAHNAMLKEGEPAVNNFTHTHTDLKSYTRAPGLSTFKVDMWLDRSQFRKQSLYWCIWQTGREKTSLNQVRIRLFVFHIQLRPRDSIGARGYTRVECKFAKLLPKATVCVCMIYMYNGQCTISKEYFSNGMFLSIDNFIHLHMIILIFMLNQR